MAQTFQQAYEQLNEQQRTAVDTTEGPVFVLAGPGTGKTQVLITRIGHILKSTDAQPENILAITFTDAAAHTVRARLAQLIGPAAYQVTVQTFHAFCAGVIQSHPDYFSYMRASEPIGTVSRRQLLQESIDAVATPLLRPANAPDLYVTYCGQAIDVLKREGVSAEKLIAFANDEYAEVVEQEKSRKKQRKTIVKRAEKQRDKQLELAAVFSEYQSRLHDSARYDFSDMIAEVVRVFSDHEELLLTYQEQFQYLLVDEYQDTNTNQNNLLFLLASYWGEQANICVVGDPNQSIFRFQGAASENAFLFLKKFPAAQVVSLKKGYRCPQKIYDAASALIAHGSSASLLQQHGFSADVVAELNTSLQSQSKERGALNYVKAPSQDVELSLVAQRIADAIANGVDPSSLAVLYRTNAEAAVVAEHLAAHEVPYQLDTGTDMMSFELAQHMFAVLEYLYAVLHRGEGQYTDDLLFLALGASWLGVDRLNLLTQNKQARANGVSLENHILSTADSQLSLLVTTLQELAAEAHHTTARTWFLRLLDETKMSAWLSEQAAVARYTLVIKSLAQQLEAWDDTKTGAQVLEKAQFFLKHIDSFKLHIPGLQLDAAVQLTTAHKAKGQEWDHVFIVGCHDGNWGNRRTRAMLPLPDSIVELAEVAEDVNAEERRLMYVALTRTKHSCTISYSSNTVTQDKVRVQLPSQFVLEAAVEDTADEHLQVQDDEKLLATLHTHLARTLQQPTHSELYRQEYRALFEQSVRGFRLSASKLNTYLTDTDAFINQYILQLPQPPAAILTYGSAIHAALEMMGKHVLRSGQKPELESVLKTFRQVLQHELTSEQEFAFRFEQGAAALTQLYDQFTLEKPVAVERFFGVSSSICMLGDIPLVGKIDRVESVDEQQKIAKIIDYKTGKVRSNNEIIGKTGLLSERELELPESIRSKYQRQILFYRLLADLDPTFDWSVASGSFVFIDESQNSVQFIEREIAISDAAVKDLSELITAVMAEIRSLVFLRD